MANLKARKISKKILIAVISIIAVCYVFYSLCYNVNLHAYILTRIDNILWKIDYELEQDGSSFLSMIERRVFLFLEVLCLVITLFWLIYRGGIRVLFRVNSILSLLITYFVILCVAFTSYAEVYDMVAFKAVFAFKITSSFLFNDYPLYYLPFLVTWVSTIAILGLLGDFEAERVNKRLRRGKYRELQKKEMEELQIEDLLSKADKEGYIGNVRFLVKENCNEINAEATVRNTIIVTSGLLECKHDIIKAVMAHELGHIKNRDIYAIFMLKVPYYVCLSPFLLLGSFLRFLSDLPWAWLIDLAYRITLWLPRKLEKLWFFITWQTGGRRSETKADYMAVDMGYGLPTLILMRYWITSCPRVVIARTMDNHPSSRTRYRRVLHRICKYNLVDESILIAEDLNKVPKHPK